MKHVYEEYDLYKIIYGREPEFKLFDVAVFSSILDYYQSLLERQIDFNILEPFAGKSEHKDFWKYFPQHSILSYKTMDIIPNDNPDVICDDIKTATFIDINLVVAYYYSLRFVKDENGNHSDQAMTQMFRNLYKNLAPTKGACIFHIGVPTNLLPSTLVNIFVPFDSPLYKTYNKEPFKYELYIEGFMKTKYSHENKTYTDYLDLTLVDSDENIVQKLDLAPFSYRQWEADEIIEIAKSQGFETIGFNSTMFGHTHISDYKQDDNNITELLCYIP